MDMESVQHTLQTGMVVKNYKEMCSLLNEKVTTGEAKQIQLRNWERFFKYKKEGHKFMITEILEKPLEKKDKRDAGNRSLFVKDIACIFRLNSTAVRDGRRAIPLLTA